MENKKRKSLRLVASVLMFALASFIISSCSKNSEDTFAAQDTANASNESTQETTASDVDDMASTVLSGSTDSGSPSGRTEGFTATDDRFCTGTTITFTDVKGTGGTATVVFPADGCTDKKGNVRKGQLTITWSGGKWYNIGSTFTVTLTNYSINGLAISGTRTVTTTGFTHVTGAVAYTLVQAISANHTYTWSGASTGTATRLENKTRKWAHTAAQDSVIFTNGPTSVGANAASGTNRNGNAFTMSITKPLVFLGTCKTNKVFIPVSGTKQLTVGTKTYTVDYGDGTCNTTFTVTLNGVSKTITAKNDNSGD